VGILNTYQEHMPINQLAHLCQMSTKQVFDYAIRYWSQIVVLAGIPLAVLKIILDRRTKRDELRFNGLLAIRNTEIKNYSLAVGVMFARINTLPVVINTSRAEQQALRDRLLEAHEELTKTYTSVSFVIPHEDMDSIETFNQDLSGISMEFIMLIINYLNDRIDFDKFEVLFDQLRSKMETVEVKVLESSQVLQMMIHKHIGV
jgi:hypothetical protein